LGRFTKGARLMPSRCRAAIKPQLTFAAAEPALAAVNEAASPGRHKVGYGSGVSACLRLEGLPAIPGVRATFAGASSPAVVGNQPCIINLSLHMAVNNLRPGMVKG